LPTLLLSEVNITANKNTVPFDPQSPFVTSGLRLGTAALTTRGFDEQAFGEVADVIAARLLMQREDSSRANCSVGSGLRALCERFPLYGGQRALQPGLNRPRSLGGNARQWPPSPSPAAVSLASTPNAAAFLTFSIATLGTALVVPGDPPARACAGAWWIHRIPASNTPSRWCGSAGVGIVVGFSLGLVVDLDVRGVRRAAPRQGSTDLDVTWLAHSVTS
jgi:hypothetical protein